MARTYKEIMDDVQKASYGKEMRKELIELGVNVITPKTEYPSGSYVAINDAITTLSERANEGHSARTRKRGR